MSEHPQQNQRGTIRRPPGIVALCFILWSSIVLADGGEPFATSSNNWEGLSEFVRLAQRRLGTGRVRLTADLDYAKLLPQDALVVLHPQTTPDADSVTAFLAAGGRMALLDDFGASGPFLQRFGIRRVPPPLNPSLRLRQDPDLALAEPVTQIVAGAERGRHPITARISHVVTNHPQALRHPDLTPVLEIRAESGKTATIAVTGIIAGKGRLLVIGDPSVFINLMLRYPGNRSLAEGMFDYLLDRKDVAFEMEAGASTTPDGEQVGPTGRLWIVSNRFSEHGQFGGEEDLWNDMQNRLEDATEGLRRMQEEGLPPWLALALAGLVALFALFTQLKDNLRLKDLLPPSFARPYLVAGQTGIAARAEVLASDRAPPALAMVEMDAALREAMAHRLGVDPHTAPERLVQDLEKAGLSPEEARSLCELMAEFRRIGESLTHGRPRRASPAQLKKVRRSSMDLMAAIARARGQQP